MGPPSPKSPTGRPAASSAPAPGSLDPVSEEPVSSEPGWTVPEEGGPAPATGDSEPVLVAAGDLLSHSTPVWHLSVTGGPDNFCGGSRTGWFKEGA